MTERLQSPKPNSQSPGSPRPGAPLRDNRNGLLPGKRPKLTAKHILEAQQIHRGYKLLAQRNGDPDHLCSVWDGSPDGTLEYKN